MISYDFKTTTPKPKWYQYKNHLSNLFLWLAKKCYAENPEVMAFICKQMTDVMIYGNSVTIIDPTRFMDYEKVKEK